MTFQSEAQSAAYGSWLGNPIMVWCLLFVFKSKKQSIIRLNTFEPPDPFELGNQMATLKSISFRNYLGLDSLLPSATYLSVLIQSVLIHILIIFAYHTSLLIEITDAVKFSLPELKLRARRLSNSRKHKIKQVFALTKTITLISFIYTRFQTFYVFSFSRSGYSN